MPMRNFTRFLAHLNRFKSEERGSVVIYFTFAIMPLLLMMGSAVDYGRAITVRWKLQNAVDAASVAVAQTPTSNHAARQTLAQNIVNANLGAAASTSHITITETDPTSGANYYQVAASGAVPTAIMNIAGFNSIAVGARSAAQNSGSGNTTSNTSSVNPGSGGGNGTGCVLSLNESSVDSIWDQGNAQVNLISCDIWDNSSNGVALAVQGNATLSARSVNVVGGVTGSNKITTTNGVNTGVGRAPDPYNSIQLPTYSGCNQTNYSANSTVTLNPGVYCNGFSLNAQAVVTLNPGVYVFDRGDFKINGQASLTGAGVTLVFTSSTGSNWPTVTINGGAAVNLSAPTSGSLAPLVVYSDRNMPAGTSFKFNGGSTQTLAGALYAPTAALNYAGGATYNASSPPTECVQLIADTVKFIGNTTTAINGCGASGYTLSPIGPRGYAKLVR